MPLAAEAFKTKVAAYKQELDDALEVHIKHLKKTTLQDYTPYSAIAVDAFTQILGRGGKRMRGALTMIGYEMCGGRDKAMILQAACAIEIVHAYILILDDIMDKSTMRRGGQSAHTIISAYHSTRGLSGESYHFGEAVAINAALIGNHYAMGIVTDLQASEAGKMKALRLLNEALVVTGHGQINDLFNEVLDQVTEQDVDRVLEWKTAHYSFLNPLQFGMALADANDLRLAAITDYCMYAGRAFQTTDDIMGTFGTEQDAGKSPMDDVREGKRTLLTLTALERAESGDKNFLIQMLGNEKITQAEFARCKEILVSTGALDEATKRAAAYIASAQTSLSASADHFSPDSVEFLSTLVSSLLHRQS